MLVFAIILSVLLCCNTDMISFEYTQGPLASASRSLRPYLVKLGTYMGRWILGYKDVKYDSKCGREELSQLYELVKRLFFEQHQENKLISL